MLSLSAPCFGEDDGAASQWQSGQWPLLNIAFGPEPFLGILGIEYQNEHHGFGIGYPNRLSYRYFIQPHRDTAYWGVYLGGMDYDDVDERKDGVEYRDLETAYFGAGGGYRWQWDSGWNVNASLTVHRYDFKFSNPGTTQRETRNGIFIFPGFNVGYLF